jgi:hypothetical protein
MCLLAYFAIAETAALKYSGMAAAVGAITFILVILTSRRIAVRLAQIQRRSNRECHIVD